MLPAIGGALGPISLAAGSNYIMWCPTYRAPFVFGTAGNPNVPEHARVAQTCFMRGLKEKIHIETSNHDSWEWRRICFTHKGSWTDEVIPVADFTSTTIGTAGQVNYNRSVKTLTTAESAALFEEIMEGLTGSDYLDPMRAKTNRKNYKIWYDVTRKINTGSDVGLIKDYNMWHPMNKNLVYGDVESGTTTIAEAMSTEGRPGMGDYYVVDLFRTITGGTGALMFYPQSILYWHEK